MEVIRKASMCSETQLAFSIRELKLEEKEYEGFQIGLRGEEDDFTFIDIQVADSQLHDTRIVVFNNLKPFTVYEVIGQVLYNDEWFDTLGTCKYLTYPNNNDLPFPINGKHSTGVSVNGGDLLNASPNSN